MRTTFSFWNVSHRISLQEYLYQIKDDFEIESITTLFYGRILAKQQLSSAGSRFHIVKNFQLRLQLNVIKIIVRQTDTVILIISNVYHNFK